MPDTYAVFIIDDSSDFEYTADLTPRIALLKTKSTTFTNFYTHPVCTLSRTGFMFGSYGKKIGTIDETPFSVLPTHPYPSLASTFLAAGYKTCCIGKWHGGVDPLYPGTHTHPYAQAPITRGYEEYKAGSAGNLGEGGDYSTWNRLDSTAAGYTVTNGYSVYAPEAQVLALTEWKNATAGLNRFVHVALNLPHAPFHVPPSTFLNGYTGETATNRGKYLAMLRAADTQVGYMLDILGTSANVFVWSDNGTPDSVPPPYVDPDRLKRSSFTEGTRVLGVYRRNGVPASVNTRLIHSIDVGATMLHSAGLAIPSEWDGVPFGRTAVLTEREDADGKDRSCRTNCYLYRELTDEFDNVTEELYYTTTDPKETVNVINDARHAGPLAWLRGRLAEAEI